MNRERVAAVVVALACVASMGVASTTLESSLSSNPDEAIQLDYDNLPIGREEAKEVKQEVQRNEANGQAESSSSSSSSTSVSAASKSTTDEQSLLEMLIALLEALLPYLVGALVLLTVVGLTYRYRRRLVAPFLALVAGAGGRSSDGDDSGRVEWKPRDEVEQAWLDLVQTAGVDRPHAKTPAECADDAVAAGYDPEPVHRLRRAFEDVRYGEMSPTDDLREQVDRSRRQLGLGGSR
jgi:hypothetical protein